MKINSNMTWKLLLPVLLSGFPLNLWANGFLLPDQDAFATARGEAFVATADNASAVYYNPAGISQLEGNNVRAGFYGIDLEPQYKSPSGQTYDNESKLHAVPQFFYTYGRTNWPVSFGLGVYSPFGLQVEWPQNTGFRTAATQGRLTTVTINPVVSVKLSPTFSIGGGVMVNYANIDLQQGLSPYPASDLFRFKGDSWDVGYNLGLRWQPVEKVSFGATVRSSATQNFKGHTETIFPPPYNTSPYSPYNSLANSSWELPLEAVFGVSYRPTPKWNLEFDAHYTDWSTIGTVNINQTAFPPFLPSTVPKTLDWQSSWLFEFGGTRFFDNGWHVSGGYVFNESSVPDASYTPLVADLDRHFFSVGTGYKGKIFNFDVAYQFSYGPSRTVTSSAAPVVNGDYSSISHAVLLTVGTHF